MDETRGPIVSPTFHVVGLALIFLAPGLLFSAAIEWGSSTSDDEWALVVSAVIWNSGETRPDSGHRHAEARQLPHR